MAKKNIQITYVVDNQQLLASAKAIKDNEKSAKDADAAINKFGTDAKKAGDGASKSFLDLGNIWKGIVAIGITRFVVDLGKSILDLGIKQEQLNIAFTTFLGSADKAKKLLGDLTKFAIVTPFTPDQVNGAAKALLSFGVAGEDIIPTLKMLGDVSSGTGKDLTEMAIIFGQIRSTGRLMGQDLLQLINAGFNPLQVISQKTGRAVADLKKDMEKGLITFDMVSDAFKSATSEGGLFFDLMAKQSTSVGGLLSTVSGNVDEALKNLFAANTGRVADFVNMLVKASEGLMHLTETADQALARMNMAISDDAVAGFKDVISKALADGLTEPEAIAAIKKNLEQSIAFAEAQLRTTQTTLRGSEREEQQKLDLHDLEVKREQLRALINYSRALDDEREKKKLEDALNKNNVLTLEKLRDESKKLADQIDKTSIVDQAEITRLIDKKKALDDYIKSLTTATDKQATNFKGVIGSPISGGVSSDALNQSIGAGLEHLKDLQMLDDQEKVIREQRLAELHNEAEEEIQIEEEKERQKAQIRQQAFNLGANLIQQLLTLSIKSNQETFQRDKGNFDERLALAGNNEKARQEIQAEKVKFDGEQDKKQAAFEKKQAERQKEMQIKQMAIQNVSNAVRALGQPPVPNFVLAGLTLAFGLAEIAAAKAIGFKDGVIGLQGPGNGTSDSIPARLSRGESVITAKATERSHDLLEAINDGRIDDRILHKLSVTNGGIKVVNDNKDLVNEIKGIKVNRFEDGYFTAMEVQKAQGFKIRMKSKYRS